MGPSGGHGPGSCDRRERAFPLPLPGPQPQPGVPPALPAQLLRPVGPPTTGCLSPKACPSSRPPSTGLPTCSLFRLQKLSPNSRRHLPGPLTRPPATPWAYLGRGVPIVSQPTPQLPGPCLASTRCLPGAWHGVSLGTNVPSGRADSCAAGPRAPSSPRPLQHVQQEGACGPEGRPAPMPATPTCGAGRHLKLWLREHYSTGEAAHEL